jgi:hypothetical protein
MSLDTHQPLEIYTEIGKVRLEDRDSPLGATWRHAKLTLRRERLTLSVLAEKRYHLEREQIDDISRYYDLGIFSQGIVISHSKDEYPTFFIFWTFAFNQLKTGLEQLGYEISD